MQFSVANLGRGAYRDIRLGDGGQVGVDSTLHSREAARRGGWRRRVEREDAGVSGPDASVCSPLADATSDVRRPTARSPPVSAPAEAPLSASSSPGVPPPPPLPKPVNSSQLSHKSDRHTAPPSPFQSLKIKRMESCFIPQRKAARQSLGLFQTLLTETICFEGLTITI